MKIKKSRHIIVAAMVRLQIDSFEFMHACFTGQQRSESINRNANCKKHELNSKLFSSLCVQIGKTGEMMQRFSDCNDEECRDAVDQEGNADSNAAENQNKNDAVSLLLPHVICAVMSRSGHKKTPLY